MLDISILNIILLVSVVIIALMLFLYKSKNKKLEIDNHENEKQKSMEVEARKFNTQFLEKEKSIQRLENELKEKAEQINNLKRELNVKSEENQKLVKSLEEKNEKLKECELIFNTMSSLFKAPKEGIEPIEEKKIENLEKFIFGELIPIIDDMNVIPNEYEEFSNIKESFLVWKITKIRGWSNKNLNIALIGKFSAGKSSIINSFLQNTLLPIDTTPTTAVPTYLSYGFEDDIYYEDVRGDIRRIQSDVFKKITHVVLKNFPISFFIKYFVVFTELPIKNINIIDTPGFSSLKDIDLDKMREGIEIADVIFYVMDIQDGTITEDAVKLLTQDLKLNGKDIYLIINKADSKPPSQREKVKNHIIDLCKKRGLPFKDILLYSAKNDKNGEYRNKLYTLIQEISNNHNPEEKEKLFDNIDKLVIKAIEILKKKRREFMDLRLEYEELLEEIQNQKSKKQYSDSSVNILSRIEKELERINQEIKEVERNIKKLSDLNMKLNSIKREV